MVYIRPSTRCWPWSRWIRCPPGHGSLFQALYSTPAGQPFTVPVRVVMVHTTHLTKDGPAARLRVCDVRTQTEFETTPIHDPQTLEFAHDSLHLGEVLELQGRIVPQPGKKTDPEAWIAVDALRPLSRPSALLGLSPELSAPLSDAPWAMNIGEDLRFPTVEGKRPALSGVLNRYLSRVHAAVEHDTEVLRLFYRVMHMLEPPTALLRPGIALRVLRTRSRAAAPVPAAAGRPA